MFNAGMYPVNTQKTEKQKLHEGFRAYLVTSWLMSGGFLIYAAFMFSRWDCSIKSVSDVIGYLLLMSFALAFFPLIAAAACCIGAIHFCQQGEYLLSLASFTGAVAIFFLWRGVRFVLYDWKKT